jgi:ornithine cyclodeaminase/alanine dehydrogenase-like protein (mu-crystallin family)
MTDSANCIRILGEDDVRALITSESALELARATLKDQAQGGSSLSTPSAMNLDAKRHGSGVFKFKAATVGAVHASGIRLISRMSATDPNAKNWCAVYDHGGLALSGLVAELWVSRIRTAAFGIAAIERLVNPGPQVVALFGTGKIAHEIVPMLASALEVKELRVTSRRPQSMKAFVAAHAPKLEFETRVVPEAPRAIDGADVVITLTEARTPLVAPGMVKRGALVCSMGGGNEIDYGVLLESQRLIVDDIDFAQEVGDGGAWIKQGRFTAETFAARVDALACEVVAGTKPGRLTPDDRIIAIMQGMAIGDVAFAAHALHEARRVGRGKLVELP